MLICMTKNARFKLHRRAEKSLKRRYALIGILLTLTIVSLLLVASAHVSGQNTMLFAPTSDQEALTTQPMKLTDLPLAEFEPQLKMEVAYAYVGEVPSVESYSHFGWDETYPVSQYPTVVYLNVTSVSTAEINSCDALIEVYLIQIFSDTGQAESHIYFQGRSCKPPFSGERLNALTNRVYDLFDRREVDGVSGNFYFNVTDNEAVFGGNVGSVGSYASCTPGLGLWSNGQPNKISVMVRRIGYITSNGNSISVCADVASAEVEHEFQKFGDGFLYNKVVPTEELVQKVLQKESQKERQIALFAPFDTELQAELQIDMPFK